MHTVRWNAAIWLDRASVSESGPEETKTQTTYTEENTMRADKSSKPEEHRQPAANESTIRSVSRDRRLRILAGVCLSHSGNYCSSTALACQSL